MSQKIHILFSLCLLFLPAISVAQDDFSIFAKQKVVVYEIADRNDRPLSEGLKKVIHQSIVDVCTNSEDYEVFEVNIAEIKRLITASGKTPSPANICQKIGQNADFIIFTTVKASQSAIATHDVDIFINSTLYRIQTATEVRANQTKAEANSQSVIQSSSKMIAELLGLSETKQGQQRATATATATTTTTTTQVESAQELFAKGKEYYYNKDYNSAVSYFEEAAGQGHAAAQYHLGDCYLNGKGVIYNYAEAFRWFRKAAEQGHVKSQFELGLCYIRGIGVIKDQVQAIKWYRKAAEQGSSEAQYNLGICLFYGDELIKDKAEAVKWWRKAAEQGHSEAEEELFSNGYI